MRENTVYKLVQIPDSEAFAIGETPQTLDSENRVTEGDLHNAVPTRVVVQLPNGTRAEVAGLVTHGDMYWMTEEGLETLDAIDNSGG